MSILWRIICGRPSRTKKYVLLGFILGMLAGIAEAVVTSIGASDFWGRVNVHFGQFGFACPFTGATLGYLIGQRLERAEAMRARPLCRSCGYNLIGNRSGICPECGTSVEAPKS